MAGTLDIENHLQPDILKEYRRWKSLLNADDDQYAGSYTIGIHDILQAHFLLIDYFFSIGEGVGGVGPKSPQLLHSALSRQFTSFGGKPKWTKRIDICATLMFGLIKNHPFHDANKRTAFLVSLLHLQKIGRTPKVAAEEFEDFTVLIADNKLLGYDGVFIDQAEDPEVSIISKFLKKKTREIDLRSKTITYRELDRILRGFGYELRNPKGNRIDLLRMKDVAGMLLKQPQRVAHIGFHAWTREVSNKDLHIVRNATRLDPENGIDSQSFFYGIDTPLDMIKKYEEPLRRLAYR